LRASLYSLPVVQAAAHPRLVGGELEEEEEDDEQNLEEMPTIADIQDERPQEVKVLEEFKKSGRWKTFLGRSTGGPGLFQGSTRGQGSFE
jgi:hypothetical protein